MNRRQSGVWKVFGFPCPRGKHQQMRSPRRSRAETPRRAEQGIGTMNLFHSTGLISEPRPLAVVLSPTRTWQARTVGCAGEQSLFGCRPVVV